MFPLRLLCKRHFHDWLGTGFLFDGDFFVSLWEIHRWRDDLKLNVRIEFVYNPDMVYLRFEDEDARSLFDALTTGHRKSFIRIKRYQNNPRIVNVKLADMDDFEHMDLAPVLEWFNTTKMFPISSLFIRTNEELRRTQYLCHFKDETEATLFRMYFKI